MSIFKRKQEPIVNDGKLLSVGIIMDGNGRWAKARGLSRSEGHVAGAKIIENVLSVFREYGVKVLTLYAFSTENWNRPKEEVDGLMELFYSYLDGDAGERIRNSEQLCVRFIGDKSRLPEKLREKCIQIEKISENRPFICNIAINYGGRNEIVYAVNSLIEKGVGKIDEGLISDSLYTAKIPDPDLIIRTGGEKRLSNFLLWQAAYSEFIFTDTLWPDFDRREIEKCIREFLKRKRRYGGLNAEELKEEANKNKK